MMHREFDPGNELFKRPALGGLYLLVAALGALIARDLTPVVIGWCNSWFNLEWPIWSNQLLNYRYAMIAAVVGGARVLYRALEAITQGKWGADLALAIACIAAIVIGEPLVAAEVVFIGLLGECLEAWTFARTQRGIQKLVDVFPKKCWKILDGIEYPVDTSEIRPGDKVAIKPGKKIPVDGVVLSGESTIDPGPMTGESILQEKRPGDTVLAGCVNQLGSMVVQATKAANDSVAGKVLAITAQAIREKSVGERQADRFARYFLPIVLGATVLVYLINIIYQTSALQAPGQRLTLNAAFKVSLYPALSVLVVACPCALVLATPAAIIAALGRLAGTGVLIKSGAALEKLAQIERVAFDKTGTLTQGQLQLGRIVPQGLSENELLHFTASLEQASEHPLGQAIVAAAKMRQLVLSATEEFQAFPGGGLLGRVDGRLGIIGSKRFLASQGIDVPEHIDSLLTELDAAGETTILIARERQLIGVIGAIDTLRNNAADIVTELKNLGLKISLLTGDRPGPANRVGAALGIDEIYASLLPTEKAEKLGEKTCFVGDGINDAPGLATATVGVAVGTGTDIAAEAGDVVLMGEPLEHLPRLIRLARETTKIIRQNLIWFALYVNLIGALITGVLWPIFVPQGYWFERSPIVAAIYHQFGSLLVLLNSMRLLGFERQGNRRIKAVSTRLQSFDSWLGRVSIDDLFHYVSHHWRRFALGALALGTLAFIATGFTVVRADEVVVVKRFGRIAATLDPGLHWRWPIGIEETITLKPKQTQIVELGFRSSKGQTGQTWSASHLEGIQRISDESLMITGDNSLIEISATLRYRIADPVAYLQISTDPGQLLRSITESVLRQLVLGQDFLALLTNDRLKFQNAASSRIIQRLQEVDRAQAGIELEGITIHDLHPPAEVVPIYHDVARAIQARDEQVNRAESQATQLLSRATEEANRLDSDAAISAHEKVSTAQAARASFLEWHRRRTQLTPAEQAKYPDAASRQQFLDERKRLTEMRLTWEVLVDVLRPRDKVIIDGDVPKGRRNLYLVDPEFLRPIIPLNRPGPSEEKP